jgi:hypothetical protein
MHCRATALVALLLSACASWAPPQDDPIRAGDSRVCISSGTCTDLVIAIDTSSSSALSIEKSEGLKAAYLGYPDAGAGSRLWVSIEGIRRALGILDSERVGVGLIGFAGEQHSKFESAWVEATVSNDFAAIDTAAARMRARGASGESCHGCAVKVAGRVVGIPAMKDRCPVLLMLADTNVTMPYGPGFRKDNERAFVEELVKLGASRSTFVAVGETDEEDALRLKAALATAGGEMILARSSVDVENAIVRAVEACQP